MGCLVLRDPAAPCRRREALAGFTLVEMLCALVVIGVLAAIALPSYQHHITAARRAEARAALAQVQLAQERWRAEQARYATLGELALPALTGEGHYELTVHVPSTRGYAASATALGAQAADGACRHLRLTVEAGQARRASGPTEAAGNDAAANRRCWQG